MIADIVSFPMASGTTPGSDEAMAAAFAHDIEHMNANGSSKKSFTLYKWPVDMIDYEHVSTPTLEKLSSLIQPLCPPQSAVYSNPQTPTQKRRRVFPETPAQTQIAREIDVQLIGRKFHNASRIIQAKKIEKTIQTHVERLYDLLRAIRREDFPSHAPTSDTVVDSIASMRQALDDIEDILNADIDLDVTEPDTEDEDADRTRVGSSRS
ncbi:hypothetical protein MSAN_01079800 [Mycena sanguinolenta]|uniref:Uncharacterized protein n=1 Tax=Mycena sanguinolenta TaxID=230812 RepID=A0A8H6YT86_9AGAR|nr:hypothetical protein MSAN_01079800 [Mycena sanguinolenta]